MTPEVEEEILTRVMDGKAFETICAAPHMTSDAALRQFLSGPSDQSRRFRARYDRAATLRAHELLDLMLAIVDDSSRDWEEKRNDNGEIFYALARGQIARDAARLRALQQELSRLLPETYGPQLGRLGV